ncbi:MAG: OmpA family protein [Bryobacterales bacterium]|nr:OmpA family protein [Bryobacterales bacterium]
MPILRCLIFAFALVFGLTSSLAAQGLDTSATKDDWEEINFEFDSSVLSDGYPSLLRLAELLNQHPDYKVRLLGHTDSRGSDNYNDKLALARAETVKSFLVKYGARAAQIDTSGQGRRDPKVDNRTNEGRFMNRRVVLTVTDAQGKVVSAGGIGEAIKALTETQAKSQMCCEDILKRLDKLDEILAALKDLRSENDRLKQDVAALKQDTAGLQRAQSGIQQQVAQLPKPPERAELAQMMESTAQKAIDETRPKRFQLLGINLGLDTTGNLTANSRARYFAPFGQNLAFQAGGEYFKFLDRQEGQVDVGLVDRYKSFQAGLFSSFKRVHLSQYRAGGTLGQAAVAMDYLFSRGRIGAYGTKSFLDEPVVNRLGLTRTMWQETYLNVVDQVGGSTQIGLHKDAYLEGNFGALFRRGGSNRPGGTARFVQPLNSHWAFTVEAGLNETLVGASDSGRFAVGLQFGNWLRPKEYKGLNHAVPMDVPRIRYEILTRTVRNGNDPPVADAGPDQIGVAAGAIQLDGSGSYDPEGDPITFAWTQLSGPAVSISGANTAKAGFTAAAGTTYAFRLSVKDDRGAEGRARVTVSTATAPDVKVVRFAAEPSQIMAGQTSTIVWEVLNAESVTISGIGPVDRKAGTSTVAPSETTTYKLTAKNSTSEVNATVTVTVGRPEVRILRFLASPANISAGGTSTLAWETENATEVTISGIGSVRPNGSTTVSPAGTTTYTLTAKNLYGEVSTTATVQVTPGEAPRIVRFMSTPVEILPSEQASLVWQVENASSVSITGIGKVDLSGTSTVSPNETTTYTLTAVNEYGEVSATVTVTVVKTVKILNFTASPVLTARSGDPSTLSWVTENATEVVITGVGPVPVNGSVAVNPGADTAYTLVAYGRRSQVSAIVIVRVGANNPPVANAGPDQMTMTSTITLDGSQSYDPDGDPITYSWRVLGNGHADIYGANTAKPSVLLSSGYGSYTFELTVTDSKRASSSATVRVNYIDP